MPDSPGGRRLNDMGIPSIESFETWDHGPTWGGLPLDQLAVIEAPRLLLVQSPPEPPRWGYARMRWGLGRGPHGTVVDESARRAMFSTGMTSADGLREVCLIHRPGLWPRLIFSELLADLEVLWSEAEWRLQRYRRWRPSLRSYLRARRAS